jgi:predicted enzyme related to lactoylglutathione lyase
MFKSYEVFSGFSVNDLGKAKEFYFNTMRLKVEEGMGLKLYLPAGGSVFVYEKKDHVAAKFTILNFEVENIDEAVEALKSSGVVFEVYEGIAQDAKGIMRGLVNDKGPDIAWFKDPAGNILSVLQTNK